MLKEWFPLLSGATDPRATGDAEKREAHDTTSPTTGSPASAPSLNRPGMSPTGKEIAITEPAFDRFADGKLVEHRAEADMLGLMQQLGAIPSLATT